jgi:hypothetical protein
LEAGITTGVAPSRFGPEGQVPRTQMAAFLWRAAGSPVVPAATVPRRQMAAFPWRNAGRPTPQRSAPAGDVVLWFDTSKAPGTAVTVSLGAGNATIEAGVVHKLGGAVASAIESLQAGSTATIDAPIADQLVAAGIAGCSDSSTTRRHVLIGGAALAGAGLVTLVLPNAARLRPPSRIAAATVTARPPAPPPPPAPVRPAPLSAVAVATRTRVATRTGVGAAVARGARDKRPERKHGGTPTSRLGPALTAMVGKAGESGVPGGSADRVAEQRRH